MAQIIKESELELEWDFRKMEWSWSSTQSELPITVPTEKVVVETLHFSTNPNSAMGKIKITFEQIGIQSEI